MQRMAAENVAPYAAKEDGTYILYGGVDSADPNVQRLLEIYRDQDAYQTHRDSEGFRNYQIARATILEQLIIMEADPFLLESKDAGTGGRRYGHGGAHALHRRPPGIAGCLQSGAPRDDRDVHGR